MEEISLTNHATNFPFDLGIVKLNLNNDNFNNEWTTNDSFSHYTEDESVISLRKIPKNLIENFNSQELTLKDLINSKLKDNKVEKPIKKIKKDEKDVFSKRKHCSKWTIEETEKFYKALKIFGTDFSMIAKVLTTRNRTQIKNKFRKEEKLNLSKVDLCLNKHTENKMFKIFEHVPNKNHKLIHNIAECDLMTQRKIRFNSVSSVDSVDKKIIEDIHEIAMSALQEKRLLEY